jgi:hypothetical protein
MGFRFSKRITLLPGIRLNLSNGMPSLSIGPRGASVTVGKRGFYGNVGLPGSGLSYRTRLDKPNGRRPAAERAPAEENDPLPLALPTFNLRISEAEIEYLDTDNNPFPDDVVATIKSAYRDQLIEAFTKRVDTLNAVRSTIADIHTRTPAPAPLCEAAATMSPFGTAKPERPTDPDALPAFMEALSAWRVAKGEHENQASGTDADLEAIAQPVLDRLGAIEWPEETNVDIDLDETGTTLILNVDLPEIEDMPALNYRVDTSNMTIASKALSQTAIAQLYARHVHGIVIRMAGESFAAQGCLRHVQISAYSQRISEATGRLEDDYLLAARISRSDWDGIDFTNIGHIDPVRALERFDLRRELKTRGQLGSIQNYSS